jgi:hypothetical protein
MLSPFEFSFWQAAIPPICMLTIPIMITSGASIWRAFLTSSVVYLIIVLIVACDISSFN